MLLSGAITSRLKNRLSPIVVPCPKRLRAISPLSLGCKWTLILVRRREMSYLIDSVSTIFHTLLWRSRALFLLLPPALLASCSTALMPSPPEPQAPVVVVEEFQVPKVYPRPSALNLTPINWYTLSGGNVNDVGISLLERHQSLMCVSSKQYEVSAKNWADVSRYLEQLLFVVEQYEKDQQKGDLTKP